MITLSIMINKLADRIGLAVLINEHKFEIWEAHIRQEQVGMALATRETPEEVFDFLLGQIPDQE